MNADELRAHAGRLRQVAESQRMDFDSPNLAMTLDESADALDQAASDRETLERMRAVIANPQFAYSLNNASEWDVRAGLSDLSLTPMFVERDALIAALRDEQEGGNQ